MLPGAKEKAVGEERLRQMMRVHRLDGVLFWSLENIRYLSGFTGDDGVLLYANEERVLLSDGRFEEQAKKEMRGSSFKKYHNKIDGLARFLRSLRMRRLGLEAQAISHDSYRRLQEKLPRLTFIALAAQLSDLRVCKSLEEVEKIRAAVRIATQGFRECFSRFRPGIREKTAASYLEYRMKIRGGEKPSFPTIVASGARAALPHGEASPKKMGRGETVVVDFGTCYQGYNSDETKTLILGPPTREQRKIYELVRKAQERAIREIRPGVSLRSIDAAARGVISRAGYGKFFVHGLGHGIGLAVHEAPSVSPRGKGKVEEGMVFSVEPGIYIPGWGGVRLEDLVWVRGRRGEVLSDLPKKLEKNIIP
jgi:Xaa-Pro aminopeptidase